MAGGGFGATVPQGTMRVADFYPGRGTQTTEQRTLPAAGAPLEGALQPGLPSHVSVAIIGMLAALFVWGKLAEGR